MQLQYNSKVKKYIYGKVTTGKWLFCYISMVTLIRHTVCWRSRRLRSKLYTFNFYFKFCTTDSTIVLITVVKTKSLSFVTQPCFSGCYLILVITCLRVESCRNKVTAEERRTGTKQRITAENQYHGQQTLTHYVKLCVILSCFRSAVSSEGT